MAENQTAPAATPEWSIKDKICIVTGSNTGIGRVTALELAKRGAAKVILACRNLEAAEEAAKEIREKAGITENDRVVVKHLDLSSFDSVKKFAGDILATEPALHVLVNNAGLENPNERKMTSDGFEVTFQTNHLGHFLLTNMLLDLLKKSKPSRIVVVASRAYLSAMPFGLDLTDVNQDKARSYNGWRQYSQSKLANILFTRELHNRLNGGYETEGSPSGISVFCLHPGIIRSQFLRYRQGWNFVSNIVFMNAISVEDGAKTSVHCACEPGIEKFSGNFFNLCKPAGLWWIAKDNAKAAGLWDLSQKLIDEKTVKPADAETKTEAN